MAKIIVKKTEIFASIGATGVLSEFGSYAESDVAYSTDLDDLQSRDAWAEGFASAVDANNSPMIQDLNTLFHVLTSQLVYLYQEGISEWNAGKTYYIGSFVKHADGRVFMSLIDDNLNNAITDTTKWKSVLTSKIVSPDDSYSVAYDVHTVFANKASAITITIPAPATTNEGREIIIKNIGAGTCSVVVTGGSTIAGNATTDLAQYGAIIIRSAGDKWDLIVKYPQTY
jgi:hypothetical protein